MIDKVGVGDRVVVETSLTGFFEGTVVGHASDYFGPNVVRVRPDAWWRRTKWYDTLFVNKIGERQ